MPPLRILHLSDARSWRGGERQTLTLARGQRQRGHQAVLACLPGTPLERRARAAGVPVVPLRQAFEIDPRAVLRVVRETRRGEFDLLHLHTPHAHTAGLAAARLLEDGGRRPRVVVSRRVAFPMRRHPLQALKYGAGVDAFVAASHAVRARLLRRGVEPARVAVIHDGVETPRPDAAAARALESELGLESSSPRLGHVGHLEPHKGQRFLLEAFALLGDRFPGAVLVIVGDGPLRGELERQARRLGIAGRVRFAGLRDDVIPALSLFDLFAMPSIQEGLGSALLDALALGVPVCAAAAGGIPEIIEDGVNGVLVRPQDPADLAAGMARVLSDPPAAKRMAEAGRRAVADRFSTERMVEETLRLYARVLAADPAAPCGAVLPGPPPARPRLTVLHLNTERGWRGGENQTLHLMRGLRRRGHAAILACQAGSPLEERVRREGIPCEPIRMRGELDLAAAARLRAVVRKRAPEIAHYHTSHAASLGTLAGLLGAAPEAAVLTKRTSFPLGGNPLSVAKCTWRVGAVVAVSGQVRDLLVREGVPEERVRVIPSGIEIERFRDLERNRGLRSRLGWDDSHFVVGNVAHLAAHKGQRLLLEAFARLRRLLPAARLLIVGEGEERPELEARAAALGIGEAVHFAGFQADVPPWLAACDLFALSSLSGEGSPAAVKEAMAAGVPVVASEVAGIREIVADGESGRIVPLGDAEALAAAALELALDPARRRALAARARAEVERFSMEAMVQAVEALYLELLAPDSRRFL
jgi:glycosyltransferase involved in cell wall biosynthesis